jgi:hypothetical protein
MKFEPSAPASSGASDNGVAPITACLTLDQPPFAGQPFTVTFRVCGNPCCPCGVVEFECRVEAAPELPPQCFDLDLFKRELTTHTHAAPDGVALGRAFLAEAQDPEWVWLCEFFLATKRCQMATMDLDTLATDLPTDFQADAGTMVSYRDVFPWAESLKFTHGGAEWFAEEQYCARPGCDCTEVGLGCFQLPAGERPSAKPLKCVTFLFYDYVSGQTRKDEAEPGSPAPAALLEALRAEHQDFAGLLRHRHGQLQHLGRRFQSKSAHKVPRGTHSLGDAITAWPPSPARQALARPGRNDSCPCGSGKKFKKCCGAA